MLREKFIRRRASDLIALVLIAIGVGLLILSTTQFVVSSGISTIINSPLAIALWVVGLIAASIGEGILLKKKAFFAASAMATIIVWSLVLFLMTSWQSNI